MTDQAADSPETQKVVRLVNYLLRLASLRTKIIRDLADYEKVLWLSDVPHERECFARAWGSDEEHEPDDWLEVENRREPELPSVPSQCKDWVDLPSLRKKKELPELLPEITRQILNPDWQEGSDQPETITRTELLVDHPEIQPTWDKYVEEKWLPWTEQHSAWERVHKVYSALFAIHQEQIRLGEEFELILGLGLLTWQTPSGQRARRHLIVADAILEFEARLGRFTVRPHTEGAKLRPELDILDIEDQSARARAEEAAKSSLSAAEDDPWEKSCVEGVLQSLVHSINSQGDYDDSLEAKNTRPSEKPVVEYAPALILRKRSAKGLTETLKRIREQIENGKAIPGEFADLAEVRTKDHSTPNDEPNRTTAAFDGEVFFPKPSNEAQRRIVDKIRTANGVLVQGPPGTGKSHTIANLICHLLATGQRTLITAKTPRALHVLEELVPDQLRPLCINLLGSGLEERRSLESSVGGILRKNEEWNEDRAKRERTELEERLRNLREEKIKVDRRLRDIRESETHAQSVAEGTYRGTAARIAEAVSQNRAECDWFTDAVSLDKTCLVSSEDLLSVLAALRQFSTERREELKLVWPSTLPSTEDFEHLVKNEASATDEEARHSSGAADERLADLLARIEPSSIEAIEKAFSSFRETQGRLRVTAHSWISDALRDVLGGNSSLWHELLRVTRTKILSIEELVQIADETRIEFPDSIDVSSLYEDAVSLKAHMANGGKLGWGIFRPKPVKERVYVIKEVKVSGRLCSTAEHFSTLSNALHVRLECEKAWNFWNGRSEKTIGPYALQLTAFKSLRDTLENTLALEDLIAECRKATDQCPGISEPAWEDESGIDNIISSCRLALARIRKRLALEAIQNVETPISRMATSGGAHPVTGDLLNAIRNRDVNQFANCLSRVEKLDNQKEKLGQLGQYLDWLRDSLPRLTEALEQTCDEQFWESRIQRLGDAWHWAQARFWIEEYIRQEDVPALATRAKQIEDEINKIIAMLASLHAWSFCFSRLNESQRRNMKAWQKNVSKITKSGTGKQDFFHRREAQKNLNNCQEAIPAWVMPLHRVWDTVNPQPGMFDVIIVDEASQCGFESLPLLFMAKKILVVGDDKQISPEAEGVRLDAVTQLMQQYLYDFEHKASFNINRSLFDHAQLRYSGGYIVLREHFRCMPEIIRFSNDLCYSDTPLIPLRQYGTDRLPPLDHVFVNSGYREGSNNRTINRPEAEAIVGKIVEISRDIRYEGRTMGVVVLQGEAQAALIENQLLEGLGAEEMERRRLVCGNPYSFQGDERDIMFLSLVAATNERIGPLTKAADERRFNVAASRARDMMVLFHSVTCDDLSSSCLRRQLLEFFENTKPQQIAGIDKDELERRAALDNRTVVMPPVPFDSWFEVDVALELLRKKYTVLAQHEVAGKRIDLVIDGGQARLAVECDGDNWHGADRYEADMQRQRQLERCGWEFFRVRESAFYSNREDALKGLWQALEKRNIHPFERNDHTVTIEDTGKDANGFSHQYEDGDASDDEDDPMSMDLDNGFVSSGRTSEDISANEIKDGILSALSKCPNHSCTLHSLTARVLKEVGVLTRGKPREVFERRVMRSVSSLERSSQIETYKAKNRRLRLLQQ